MAKIVRVESLSIEEQCDIDLSLTVSQFVANTDLNLAIHVHLPRGRLSAIVYATASIGCLR
jgi:hypothetical protein